MIYTLYFLYRYYNSIYYIIGIYHSYRISYDIYRGGYYVYNNIPNISYLTYKDTKINRFEIINKDNNWQYINIF